MFNALVSAIRTLTILPVPGKDTDRLADTLPWFPLVGGLLGVLLWGLGRGMGVVAGSWPEGAAVLVVAASAVFTRGLHLDGVADWFDALGAGKNRDRMLTVMKDSNVGAFGAIALTLILLIKWTAVFSLIETHRLGYILAVYVISRAGMAELAVCLPYARKEGGTGGPFVQNAKKIHRYAAWGVTLLLVIAIFGAAGAVLFVAGAATVWGLGAWFYRRINGITGDLLGTCCELTETALLCVCAGAGSWLDAFPATFFQKWF